MLGHRRGPGRPRKNAIIPSTRSKAVNTVVARRRARNGYVTWEVPKKHFLQLQQYLRSLQATGKAEANTEVDEEPQIMGGRNSKEVNIDAQEDTQELAVEKTIESDSTVTQATETVEADVQEETLDA
jgi:hypothetical protein